MSNTYASLTPRTNAWAVAELLVNAQPHQHIQNLAGQAAQPVPENKNDTIVFRRYLNLPINITPLTEGTTTDNANDLTYEDFTVQLKQYGSFTTISDKALLLHEDPLLAQALQLEGEQAGKVIETIGWNTLSANLNVILTGTAALVTDVVVPFTMSTLRNAVRFLDNNDAPKIKEAVSTSAAFNTTPIAEAYYCLMHPDLKKDLRNLNATNLNGNINDFIPVEQYGNNSSAISGEVGSVEDIRFLSSTIYKPALGGGGTVATDGTATVRRTGSKADVYTMVVLGKNAYSTVAVKGMWSAQIMVSADMATRADPYKSARTISWKMWYAIVITNPRNIISIKTASAV